MVGIFYCGGMIFGILCMNFYKGGVDGFVFVCVVFECEGIDVLILIGGEDMFGVVVWLLVDGVFVVGVFKMIDNDFVGIDVIFGFYMVV